MYWTFKPCSEYQFTVVKDWPLCLFSTAARKRQRRDKDRTWDTEERERRGSGEHRKSAQRDGRRGSGSRYRDSSEEDSPPPSISEGLNTSLFNYDSFL